MTAEQSSHDFLAFGHENAFALLFDRPFHGSIRRQLGQIKRFDGKDAHHRFTRRTAAGTTLAPDSPVDIPLGDDLSFRIQIANQGENFSAGANLMIVLLAAQEGDWDELNAGVQRFQQANMAIKYSPKPVVAAPFEDAPDLPVARRVAAAAGCGSTGSGAAGTETPPVRSKYRSSSTGNGNTSVEFFSAATSLMVCSSRSW